MAPLVSIYSECPFAGKAGRCSWSPFETREGYGRAGLKCCSFSPPLALSRSLSLSLPLHLSVARRFHRTEGCLLLPLAAVPPEPKSPVQSSCSHALGTACSWGMDSGMRATSNGHCLPSARWRARSKRASRPPNATRSAERV